ncbi:MAG: hypothetical protein AAB354_09045, partial [candidate division KSB1 bacterium]
MIAEDLLKRALAGARLVLKKIAEIFRLGLKKASSVMTRNRSLVAASLLASMLLVGLGFVAVSSETPPLASFEKARLTLSRARHAEAAIYAPGLLHEAEASWEQAAARWEKESKKWRHQRQFRGALIATIKTARLADSAATVAAVNKDSLQWLAATGISLVKEKIETLRAQFE